MVTGATQYSRAEAEGVMIGLHDGNPRVAVALGTEHEVS